MSISPLDGKHAVVTGGGTGIGAAVAERLAALGARVTLMARNRDRLTEKAQAIGNAQAVAVDITDADAVTAAFAEAEKSFGPVDILVNNAGAAVAVPFHKLSLDDWNKTITVNLNGTFHCIRAVYDGMRTRGSGRIINVASTAGLTGYAYVSAYTAAKHGVIGLTRSLALELATKGVTVNAVCPGYTETEIVRSAIDNIVAKTGRSEAEARAELTARNPQGKMVQPQEVASAVAWLALPEQAAITGQAIAVAGGEVM
ncbi:SDR family NAD(P)-dependent oxidoreductase [Govanella unica]|uniref:SDR family oxidoreductase n=1 Tax=Govanella unica TaxID=2975056 RepID=A0A9X3Z7F2_9PROT|nr:SDR family NAD(P)-dependent oxidoreductase [Govania unica]MDA5193998.1 SDR family oxidoreductase [Govania unica]